MSCIEDNLGLLSVMFCTARSTCHHDLLQTVFGLSLASDRVELVCATVG